MIEYGIIRIFRLKILIPICYDIFGDKELISCPDCKAYIHKECMCIWLKTSKTCVCCRSNSYANYITNINLIK